MLLLQLLLLRARFGYVPQADLQPIFPPLSHKQPEYLPLCPAGFVLNKSRKLGLERDPKGEVSWELSLSAGMSMSPHEIMPACSCLTLCSSSRGSLTAPTAGDQCTLVGILCDHARSLMGSWSPGGHNWSSILFSDVTTNQSSILRCMSKIELVIFPPVNSQWRCPELFR